MMTAPSVQTPGSFTGPPDPDLMRLRDLIYKVAGIFHPDNKLRLLEERCSRRMKVLQINSFAAYCECLTTSPSQQAERIALLNEITIGETCFFRNQPQLDALRQVVLSKVIEAKAKLPVRRFRIWSAGCSTGEEPYTLSMIALEEANGRLKDWAVEIFATDINERSLAHAQKAIYGSYSTRNLTNFYKQKYFTASGEELQVQTMVRGNVSFSRVNLSDESRMLLLQGMDVIFCCNVLIYFDLASKQRVIQQFHGNLLPHGYLFLGHSESLYGVNDDFRLVHLPGATAYIKAGPAQAGK